MTESRNGNVPQGDHEYAMWDAAYVLDALSDTDRREFEMHMTACNSCRQAVAELEAIPPMLSLLDEERAVLPPCPDLLPSLLAKADQRLAANRVELQPALLTSTTVAAETVFPVFRTGNYAPVPDEFTAFDLPVEGKYPDRTERLVSA